jgi:uroporphyrinogen-III decarboxylase
MQLPVEDPRPRPGRMGAALEPPMTPRARLLTALNGGIPDRLPITIHQWQGYHLRRYMGGIDDIAAFRATGLDASITVHPVREEPSPSWQRTVEELGEADGVRRFRVRIRTPDGELVSEHGQNDWTTFTTRHLCQTPDDVEILLRHLPIQRLDRAAVAATADRLGADGIVRGFVGHFGQPGCWQSFNEMVGTETAIMWAADEPDFVHRVLGEIARRCVDYVGREMAGARYDLIEHGGGTASCTVISPRMFSTFVAPYDRPVVEALRGLGLPVTYHTCGGMMRILDRIGETGAAASETLSPPAVGGNIAGSEQRRTVKRVLGSRLALIGGIDQGELDRPGSAAGLAAQVRACFEDFGPGGGYICSASDHFFHAPRENFQALAAAARECRY